MSYPQLEEKLQHARHALNSATSENIIALCKQYLALLAEYRGKLYDLQGTPGIRQPSASSSSPKDLADLRKAIRASIENTTKERNRTEVLLLSLTTVSGYDAVKIFNRRKYEGHNDWELRASGIKFRGGTGHALMTIQEAVETASLIRREEHIAQNAAQPFKEN
jgi:CRISPR/Cas system endoribonuclease Cas6 (RAMP superfamily)